jgi:hypothetical protein
MEQRSTEVLPHGRSLALGSLTSPKSDVCESKSALQTARPCTPNLRILDVKSRPATAQLVGALRITTLVTFPLFHHDTIPCREVWNLATGPC